jgi:hypothetical protein
MAAAPSARRAGERAVFGARGGGGGAGLEAMCLYLLQRL